MHLKITYIFVFESLFSRNIVFLYLKDWEVVQNLERKENSLSNNEAMGSTRINLFFSFLNNQTTGRV